MWGCPFGLTGTLEVPYLEKHFSARVWALPRILGYLGHGKDAEMRLSTTVPGPKLVANVDDIDDAEC